MPLPLGWLNPAMEGPDRRIAHPIAETMFPLDGGPDFGEISSCELREFPGLGRCSPASSWRGFAFLRSPRIAFASKSDLPDSVQSDGSREEAWLPTESRSQEPLARDFPLASGRRIGGGLRTRGRRGLRRIGFKPTEKGAIAV